MTISTVKIQDKDSHRKLSVVQSTEDPTKWGVVILNPDGSAISPSGSFVRGPESSTDGDIPLFDGTDGHKIKDSGKSLSDFVDITNNQTVGGVKTFTDEPVLPAKSSAATSSTTAPATEKQVYDVAQGLSTLDSSAVKTTGNQSIGGTKTFTDEPVIPSKSALPVSPSNTSPATEGQVKSVKDAIPAVENVLTSTSTTNALSAAQGKALNDSIGTINGKIPTEASTSNKLADKNYVNDSINSITAYYITKNAAGDQWATYAELAAATVFYSGGVVRVPTRNDYCIVLADENHDNACTRYIYQNSQWEFQYVVNETALTQAQLDALNSGITSGKVSTYDGYATTISGKQDALTLPSTPTQGNLVTWGADNKTLVDGGAVPTGFSPASAGTTGNILIKTAGGYDWGAAPDVSNVKAFYLASTSDLTNAQAAYDWYSAGKNPILIYGDNSFSLRQVSASTLIFSSPIMSLGNNLVVVGATRVLYYTITLNLSSSTVTSISYGTQNLNVLDVSTDYDTPYTPTYNGSPATKKYVDDNVAYVGSSAPSSPTEGKLWYDTTNDVLKVYNGSSWDGVGGGLPAGGTEGQILMIVSGTPTWVTPTAKGFKMLSPNSPLTVPYDWYGTEAQYSSATKSNDTEYRTV